MFSLANFARTGCLMILIATLGAAPAQEPIDDDVNIPDGLEVQTRGPVHEAYAHPNDLKPEPGQVVAQAPPPPVPEQPPEFRPEGDNIEWISGYWAWDPERTDYLWVSGTYREVPEDRRWVPGYWANTDNGWQWIPGFWASARQEEVPYTPEPPEPLNNEPNLPAPDDDSTWLPGYWQYNETRFVWRPGYWAPCYDDRVWVTPRYIWTPTGYLFCDGYWDYPYYNRGLLFAPVYFNRPLWHTAGWFYRPWYTVGLGLFHDHCFWRPGGLHFFFGNYYGNNFWGLGYRPWFNRYRWDPGFAHYNWWNSRRGDRNWYGRQRQLYADRFDGRGARPPRDFDEQRRFAREGRFANNRDLRAVAPVQQAKLVNNNVNIIKTSAAERQKLNKQVARNQELQQLRNKLERQGAVGPKGAGAKGAGPKGIGSAKVRESTSFRLPRVSDDEDLALTRPSGAKKDGRDGGPTAVGKDLPKGKDGAGKQGVATRPSGDKGKKGPPPISLNPGAGAKPRVLPRDNDGPKGGQPKVAQPKVNQPKVAQPNITRPKGDQPKVGQPRPDAGGPKAGPPKANAPKSSAPRIIDSPRTPQPNVGGPRNVDVPRVNPQPQNTPAPKARVNESPLPRIIESPRGPGDNRPAPRVEPRVAPRSDPLPRVEPRNTPAPRIQSQPIPRFEPRSNPAPRFNNPSPAPRFNPAPRATPAPRASPAPRPAPRAAPRAAPRGKVSAPSRGQNFIAAPRASAPRPSASRASVPRPSAPRASAAQRSAPSQRSAPARSSSQSRGKRR